MPPVGSTGHGSRGLGSTTVTSRRQVLCAPGRSNYARSQPPLLRHGWIPPSGVMKTVATEASIGLCATQAATAAGGVSNLRLCRGVGRKPLLEILVSTTMLYNIILPLWGIVKDAPVKVEKLASEKPILTRRRGGGGIFDVMSSLEAPPRRFLFGRHRLPHQSWVLATSWMVAFDVLVGL